MRILLKPPASSPDGPAAPFVLNAALAMDDSSMLLKTTGSVNGTSPFRRTISLVSFDVGCFDFR